MRLFLILFVFAFSLYAETVSKNILIIDGEKSFFSKSILPAVSDYSFSSIEPEKLNEDVLAVNDTAVLFQSDVPKLKEKETFLRWVKNGGKLIIMNKESKTPYNRFDWLDYGYIFATNSAASNSKNSAKYAKITEYNFLTKSLDIDNIDKNTNAFADSTVMIFSENLWNSALEVTNSNDVTGSAFAYSKYGKGIFIFFGLNIRDIHKNSALKDIYRAILELPWFPDPLPYTNATGAEIPPPLVRISGISSNKVDIAWKIPAWLKGIRGYKVYRSSDNGETKELLANVSDASFYRDLSAIDGNSYLYFVTSYDDSRDSSFSEPVKALPPGDVFDEKEMSIITPDGENTTPVTALTTADNFDHIVGDAFLTSQKISGDPVSLATGGFYLEVEDIKFPMKNTLLEFLRSYNSIFKESSDNFRIGNGWRHNYMMTINPNSDGTISIKWGDGHSDLYLKSSDDGKVEYFEPASNRVYAKLKKTRNEGYTLIAKDKKTYKFDDSGKLLSIELINKGGVNLEYDYDKLIKITDKKSSRFINIAYEKNNISKVCAMDKICVFYSFDEKNNLIKVVDAKNNAIFYEYNDKYQMISSKSGGIEFFRNEYSKGQVIRQFDAVLNETKFEYLPLGITKVTDREGRVFEYKHDSLGRLIEERDPLKNSVFYHYNTRGEVEKRVNKDNTAKEFGYDEIGNKIFAKDESLNTKTMEYDKNSNLAVMIDENGNETNFFYDEKQRIIKIEDSLKNSTNYVYNEKDELVSSVDALEGEIKYRYDENSDLKEIEDALGNIKKFVYDEFGRVKKEIDEEGNGLSYEYDHKNRVTRITDADGNAVEMAYDEFGNLISKTSPNGYKTTYEYDKNFRLTKKIEPNGGFTLYRYSKEGNLVELVDANNNSTKYEYDALNRKTAIIASDGGKTTINYGLNGKITSFVDPIGNKISLEYDKRALLNEAKSPLLNASSTVYAKNALAKTITDPLGRKKEFVYDANNRVITVIDARGNKIHTGYDRNGNKIATIINDGKKTDYFYNKNNLLSSIKEADLKETKFFYTKTKQISKIEYPSKKFVEFVYDKSNRLIGKKTSNDAIYYELDKNGNKIKSIFDSNSSIVTKKYDEQNNLISQTDQFLNTVSFKYDKMQNLKEITYSDGTKVGYEYDAMNRLISVIDFNKNITRYGYQKDGKLSSVALANGHIVSYEYDKDGRLVKKIDKKNDEILSSYEFVLNGSGERIKERKKEPISPKRDRLEFAMEYGEADVLKKSNKQKFIYDEDGNFIKNSNGTIEIKYDEFNRMIYKNGTKYGYDAENLRVTKEDENGFERYVYDTSSPIAKLIEIQDKNGKIKAKFVYGLGLISQTSNEGTFVYHYDTRGSAVAVSDIGGKIHASYSYDIYGKITNKDGSFNSLFTYVGQHGVIDDNDGFYHMRTREYSAEMMRFVQKDKVLFGTTINSQSMNRYSYVEGDPIRGIDPLGAWFLGDDILASGFGALIEVAKQVVTDIAEGQVSPPEVYVAAAVKGATKAQVLLYTANIALAEASGTFAGDIAKQGVEIASGKKSEIDYKGALKLAAVSAVGAHLTSSAKVVTGFDEAVKEVKEHAISSIKNIAPRVTELTKTAENKRDELKTAQPVLQNSDIKIYKFK